MKTFKQYIEERMTDSEHDDIQRRKESHKREADKNKENLKTRKARYKDSPE